MRGTTAQPFPTVAALSCLSSLLLLGCAAPSPTTEAPTEASTETTAEAPDQAPAETTDDATDDVAETPGSPEAAETRRPPGGGLPPGGTDRLAQEKFDPELHGEPSSIGYYSEEGAQVGVAGLDPAADPLQVYAEPTESSEVVGELQSTDAVELGGRERQHREGEDRGLWIEIRLADGYAWHTSSAEPGGIYWFGGTEEITEEFTEVGSAQDPLELVEAVGAARVERGGGAGAEMGPSRVLISEPEDFDEEFYRVDVTGMPDDSVSGERLFITLEDAGADYELREVRRTVICHRGVSASGLCT